MKKSKSIFVAAVLAILSVAPAYAITDGGCTRPFLGLGGTVFR